MVMTNDHIVQRTPSVEHLSRIWGVWSPERRWTMESWWPGSSVRTGGSWSIRTRRRRRRRRRLSFTVIEDIGEEKQKFAKVRF